MREQPVERTILRENNLTREQSHHGAIYLAREQSDERTEDRDLKETMREIEIPKR